MQTRDNALPVLSARGLTKRFGPVVALEDIDFEIRPGEVRALCGENGAGKSTFIKLLTGVHAPDGGTMKVHGHDQPIKSPRDAQIAGIALVAQELSVCPDLSVVDNIWRFLSTKSIDLKRLSTLIHNNESKLIRMVYEHTCSAMSPIRRAASVGLLALRYNSTASSHLLFDDSTEAYRVSNPSTCQNKEGNEVMRS